MRSDILVRSGISKYRIKVEELILLGDFNKNLAHEHSDLEWLNFTMSLGLSQMVSQPARVTPTTLIDYMDRVKRIWYL